MGSEAMGAEQLETAKVDNQSNVNRKIKKQVVIDMSDDPDFCDVLNDYRIELGWTWKRFFLVGLAESVSKQGTNPELALALVDYLRRKR